MAELREIRLQMASMHRVMGRSATFVNTTLIGSRPNRANTTCSHESVWREEENKKSMLHTLPNDKSGVKRGKNLLDRTWEWHKTGSESERNRRRTQRVKNGHCPRGDWGRVQGLEQGFLLFTLMSSRRCNKTNINETPVRLLETPESKRVQTRSIRFHHRWSQTGTRRT